MAMCMQQTSVRTVVCTMLIERHATLRFKQQLLHATAEHILCVVKSHIAYA